MVLGYKSGLIPKIDLDNRNTDNDKRNDLKVVKKRLNTKKIKQITEGIFSTAFDITLFCLYLPLCSLGKNNSSRGVYESFSEAEILLKEVNYQTFKHSFQILRRKRLINSLKNWTKESKITTNGKKRLENILPQYNLHRPWNKKIYLVNYDFSIKQNHIRDLFRDYIRRLGAIELQKSLYLTAYNPQRFINKFQAEHKIRGVILVSVMGKEGFIDKEDLREFIWEIANLEEVNENYRDFIHNFKNTIDKKILFKAICQYYSTLKKDPQLPFELLLDKYLGDEAYLLFKKLTINKED